VGIMPSIEILNNLFYQNNLLINNSLKEVKSQFQDYHRASDKDGNLLNKPADHQEDHLVDSARYVIASLYATLQNKKLNS
jgi:phage terminase large subunit